MIPSELKIVMFDDLQETAEALRKQNDELIEELDRCNKRFATMAWSLECLARMAKDLPEPKQEETKNRRRK